jgi:autotransporter-associated beta strand protein
VTGVHVIDAPADGNLGTGGLNLGNGSTLSLTASFTLTHAISVTGDPTFDVASGQTVSVSSVISGTGDLDKTGAGTLVLANTDTHSGATKVGVGTLTAGSDASLSSLSAFDVSGGATLDVNGHNVTIGSLADGTGGGIVTNSGIVPSSLTTGGDNSSTTFSGTIEDGTHALALIKNGSGTFTLAGNNSYSGGTTVNGGALSISADGNLGTGGLNLGGGSSLHLTASFTLAHAISVTGDPTFDVASGQTVAVSSVISGSGDLDKTGAGTLVFGSTDAYTGGTVLNTGTLDLAAAGAAGSGRISFAGTATLEIDNAALVHHVFHNIIGSFGKHDILDLTGLHFHAGATATYRKAGHHLIVHSGHITDTLTLFSPHGTLFTVANDRHGGTRIVLHQPPHAASVAADSLLLEDSAHHFGDYLWIA